MFPSDSISMQCQEKTLDNPSEEKMRFGKGDSSVEAETDFLAAHLSFYCLHLKESPARVLIHS